MHKEYLTTKEVADKFGIKESTLRKQRWGQYGIPFVVLGRKKKKKNGGVVRYNVNDLQNYVKKNTHD